ncbi:MAG: hypothetical protein IT558_04655 [Alphaproteobacteria bacterium]|nr:hypothetical protein [Alphaproteobacteria bacterium]
MRRVSAASPEQALNSTHDRQKIEKIFLKEIYAQIAAQHNQHPDAVKLFQEKYDFFKGNNNNREEFYKRLDALDAEELAALLRYNLTEKDAVIASYRRAQINRPDTKEQNPYHYPSIMAIAEAGKARLPGRFKSNPAAYIEHIALLLKEGETGTRHPTGDHHEAGDLKTEEDGVDRVLNLVLAGRDNKKGLSQSVSDMLNMDLPLAPERKQTGAGEIFFSARHALRHRNARSMTLLDMKHDYKESFKDHPPHAPDFAREDKMMDLAYRVWQDTDGQPNNEFWSFLTEASMVTYLSFAHTLWKMEQASALAQSPEKSLPLAELEDVLRAGDQSPDQIQPEMRHLYALLSELKKDAENIMDKAAAHLAYLQDPGIDREERIRRFQELQPEFEKLEKSMGRLYDGKQLSGRPFKSNQGWDVYKTTIGEFEKIRVTADAKEWGQASKLLIEDILQDLTMDGFAFYKPESRGNHRTINEIFIDNLFRHEPFLKKLSKYEIISEPDLALIRYANLREGFSSLELKDVLTILKKIEDSPYMNGDLLKFQAASNPEGYDHNGYPAQNWALHGRMRLMSQYPRKWSPLYPISESNEKASRIQAFIFSPYPNLRWLIHAPLVEHPADAENTVRTQALNYVEDEQERIKRRKATETGERFMNAATGVSTARSDTEKIGGRGAALQIPGVHRKIVRQSADLGVPTYLQEPRGFDTMRSGGDRMALPRLRAQEFQKWERENGRMAPESKREKYLSTVLGVFVTGQGRERYKTAEEMSRQLKDDLAELTGFWLELDGVVKPGTFIPQDDDFSPDMKELLDYCFNLMPQVFEKRRHAKNSKGEIILDNIAALASNPRGAKAANNGFRPLSKTNANTFTGQRAIGATKWSRLMRVLVQGFSTSEILFECMHKASHGGLEVEIDGKKRTLHINKSDIENFKRSKYFDYHMNVRTLIPLQISNFEKILGRLNLPHKHKTLMAAGKNADVDKDGFFHYGDEQGYTPEQAWTAQLYRSAQVIEASTNALCDGSFIKSSSFEEIEKKARGRLTPSFNENAHKKWVWLKDVRRETRRALPDYEIMDYMEEKIKAGDSRFADEALQRAAAAAWAAATVPQMAPVTLERNLAHGRRNKPFAENPASVLTVA